MWVQPWSEAGVTNRGNGDLTADIRDHDGQAARDHLQNVSEAHLVEHRGERVEREVLQRDKRFD